MLLRVCGAETSLVDLPSTAMQSMLPLAQRFDSDAYVYMIAVLEELRRSVRSSAVGRALVEAALVRLASGVSYQSVQSLLDQIGSDGGRIGDAARSAGPRGGELDEAKKKVTPAPGPVHPPVPARAAAPPRFPAPPALPRGGADQPTRPAQAAAPRPSSPAPGRAESAPAVASPPTGDTLKEAASQPLVRAALEIFDGSLVNVEKVKE